MLNKIDANEAPIINGDGTQAYDFIYVEDVARANVLALRSSSTDQFYNVGSGIQTSIAKLCELILELKSSDIKVKYRPYDNDDARRLVQHRIGCPKRHIKTLAFKYTYSLKEGLEKLIIGVMIIRPLLLCSHQIFMVYIFKILFKYLNI